MKNLPNTHHEKVIREIICWRKVESYNVPLRANQLQQNMFSKFILLRLVICIKKTHLA